MSTHAAAHPRLRSRNRTTIPRRRSGPAARPKVGFGDAVVATGKRLGDARVLDRLVRGRAWIAIVAVLLLGIVFMQVSLLRLNAQIGTAVTASENLDRANSGLRADIAQLDSGERIQGVAAKLGMVMPPAGQVHFLNAREANPALAAASVTAPKPVQQTQAVTAPVQQTPAVTAPVQQTTATVTPTQQTP
jgi:cell division protein FtsL